METGSFWLYRPVWPKQLGFCLRFNGFWAPVLSLSSNLVIIVQCKQHGLLKIWLNSKFKNFSENIKFMVVSRVNQIRLISIPLPLDKNIQTCRIYLPVIVLRANIDSVFWLYPYFKKTWTTRRIKVYSATLQHWKVPHNTAVMLQKG